MFAGIVLFTLVLILPRSVSLSGDGVKVAAVAVLMSVWWITEALPLAATALLPIALFPVLGVMKASDSAAPYANHLIFLFLGGFLIAVTMERWNLHRRLAIRTIKFVGSSPERIILGFMLASAFLSMWISNTATAMMMVPIALAIVKQLSDSCRSGEMAELDPKQDDSRFGTALMLGIAYSASIGGAATIIGTPPNVILAGFIENRFGHHVSFASWMMVGVPLAAIMLSVSWYFLTKVAFPFAKGEDGCGHVIPKLEVEDPGPMSRGEKGTLIVFLCVAAAWILRGFVRIQALSMMTDSTIAIIGAIALFIIPVDFRRGVFLLDWKTAVGIPWSVIILFGGGLSLANGFKVSGLDLWIGSQLGALKGVHYSILISSVVLLTIFLTEITSNTATSAMILPVIGGIAVSMSIHPYGPLIGAGIAASYAFMLPVATPPNAVIFASGRVSISQMAKTGLLLNVVGWMIITIFIILLMPLIWRIDLSALPN